MLLDLLKIILFIENCKIHFLLQKYREYFLELHELKVDLQAKSLQF